jgi:hypothetical protein
MKFGMRVDDLGWQSTGVVDPGLRLAQRFHAAMAGLPYLGGVIPAALDDAGVAWLVSKPTGLTIAIHGWDHGTVDGVRSEFRGKDLGMCRRLIDRGQKLMGGPYQHFIPPFNSLEPDLPEACYHEGIRYIWGAPSSWPTPPQPYPLERVTFVPSWERTYAATLWRMGPDDIPLLEMLPRIMDLPGKAVICLHATWEAAKSEDFKGVRWLVDLIGDRVISPDEYLA